MTAVHMPVDYSDRILTFRFNQPFDAHEAPSITAETEARLARMYRLRDAARAEAKAEPDVYERRGAQNIVKGASYEIANLLRHLDRLAGVTS